MSEGTSAADTGLLDQGVTTYSQQSRITRIYTEVQEQQARAAVAKVPDLRHRNEKAVLCDACFFLMQDV